MTRSSLSAALMADIIRYILGLDEVGVRAGGASEQAVSLFSAERAAIAQDAYSVTHEVALSRAVAEQQVQQTTATPAAPAQASPAPVRTLGGRK